MSCQRRKYHKANQGWKLYVDLAGLPWDLTEGEYTLQVYIRGCVNTYYQDNDTSAGVPHHGVSIEGPRTISILFGGHYDGDADTWSYGWDPDEYYLEVRVQEASSGAWVSMTTECFTVYEEVECG